MRLRSIRLRRCGLGIKRVKLSQEIVMLCWRGQRENDTLIIERAFFCLFVFSLQLGALKISCIPARVATLAWASHLL